MLTQIKSLTPLSWCMAISTIANVTTAVLDAWFFAVMPCVHVSGGRPLRRETWSTLRSGLKASWRRLINSARHAYAALPMTSATRFSG
jgi:hypothetical protein